LIASTRTSQSSLPQRARSIRNPLRIWLCSLAAVLVAVSAPATAADPYPTRPIRFLVPNPPGGANDVLTRIVGQKLSEAMGQPVIVDNRPGGAGILATELVARAVPDGHTLLLGFNGNLAFTPALRRTPYDPVRDFAPVALVADSQYLMVAHASVPNSLKAFVAYAKSRPGQINYSTAGSGSPSHLAAELFKQAAGINLVHVAYNGGAPAATAVMSGEAQLFVGSVPVTLPHVRAGRLLALGVTGSKRSAIAAEIPTIAEAGYPGFEVSAWYGVLVPARTPNAIIARLNAEILKLLRLPDAIEQMRRQGLDATGSTPEQFAAHIGREVPKWAGVVKNAGIKAD
jgi:tripartite-type tricarboxylate transporter receptor subunit TctC